METCEYCGWRLDFGRNGLISICCARIPNKKKGTISCARNVLEKMKWPEVPKWCPISTIYDHIVDTDAAEWEEVHKKKEKKHG